MLPSPPGEAGAGRAPRTAAPALPSPLAINPEPRGCSPALCPRSSPSSRSHLAVGVGFAVGGSIAPVALILEVFSHGVVGIFLAEQVQLPSAFPAAGAGGLGEREGVRARPMWGQGQGTSQQNAGED